MTRRKWTAETGFYGLFDVYDEDGNILARVKTQDVARLMAAAPELLETSSLLFDASNDSNLTLALATKSGTQWNRPAPPSPAQADDD